MIRSTFNFCAPASDKLSPREQKKWQKEIYRRIQPLLDSCTSLDCAIDLDSPNLPELVRVLEELHKKKVGWLNCISIEERLVDDEQAPVEWFLVKPRELGEYLGRWDLRQRQPPAPGRADREKPGTHVAGLFDVYVSERAKSLAEAHGLTGVEFL